MLFLSRIQTYSLTARAREFPDKGLPRVVWVGDSHIRRFKEWYEREREQLPYEDRLFLDGCGWAASGGSKLDTFVNRIGGFNLPARQRHQGDQWTELIVRHPYPYAVALSMGSNDISDLYRVLIKWRINEKRRDKSRDPKKTETRWFCFAFRRLTKNAYTHVKFLRLAYPRATFWYISVIMSPGWPPIVQRLARWM